MTNLILVVYDDLSRIQLGELLEQSGYLVAEAGDGEQALTVYAQLQPDLVLLMDGITCCARLQKLPTDANTPLLMITGF